MCRLCGASAWPRKSSYPARDFSRGSPYTRGYFTGIPGTYSEAPAGYPQGFGITCGRYCMHLCSPYMHLCSPYMHLCSPPYSPMFTPVCTYVQPCMHLCSTHIHVCTYVQPTYAPMFNPHMHLCSTPIYMHLCSTPICTYVHPHKYAPIFNAPYMHLCLPLYAPMFNRHMHLCSTHICTYVYPPYAPMFTPINMHLYSMPHMHLCSTLICT